MPTPTSKSKPNITQRNAGETTISQMQKMTPRSATNQPTGQVPPFSPIRPIVPDNKRACNVQMDEELPLFC
jgi:hypothetical protein